MAIEMDQEQSRTIILTGVTDDHYRASRSDNPIVCTSGGKRILLYRAIGSAAGSPPLLLSPHSRGRGAPIHLPSCESKFGDFKQLFSAASGVRKVRFIGDMIRYANHVYHQTRNGDVLIFDNYELIYVLALHYCRIRGRKNPIILEYEDGKHEIDRGWVLWISNLAENLGKRLLNGAIIATPSLLERLPRHIPTEIVPGLLRPDIIFNAAPSEGTPVHFIYSGSHDVERGVPLLLDYLESSLVAENTVYHVTGQGHYGERFLRLMERYPKKVHFHGCVSELELTRLRGICHYGLNLQSSSNPISRVTFPSKTFDYMNAGLRVVSTRAACVEDVLGESAIYLATETVDGLADAIQRAAHSLFTTQSWGEGASIGNYSFDGTVRRLSALFGKISAR